MAGANKSIAAYDDFARVASYDADMDIMHPNRQRMAGVIVEVLELAGFLSADFLLAEDDFVEELTQRMRPRDRSAGGGLRRTLP